MPIRYLIAEQNVDNPRRYNFSLFESSSTKAKRHDLEEKLLCKCGWPMKVMVVRRSIVVCAFSMHYEYCHLRGLGGWRSMRISYSGKAKNGIV